MAHPIVFRPAAVDPQKELMGRVEAAPREHAEALLVLWDLLQVSHEKGLLDLALGVVEGKDIITGKLAEAAALPESVAAIRNGMALARVLGALDPDMLQRLAKGLAEASAATVAREKQAALHGEPKERAKLQDAPDTVEAAPSQKREKPPGMFALVRRAMSADGRRGLGFATELLVALGRALKG